jgi:hypothetical protein
MMLTQFSHCSLLLHLIASEAVPLVFKKGKDAKVPAGRRSDASSGRQR